MAKELLYLKNIQENIQQGNEIKQHKADVSMSLATGLKVRARSDFALRV
jgi:hypothetical protein